MNKLLASVCIIASAVIFGMELSKHKRMKLCVLREICNALDLLHGEMRARPAHISVLCLRTSEKCRGQAGEFFLSVSDAIEDLGQMSFAEIWEKSMINTLLDLDRQAKNSFRMLGEKLGAFGIEEQLKAISFCKEELELLLTECARKYEGSKKLFLGIPCSLAAMLLVVLL